MRVRINQAIAANNWSYRRGQIVEMGEQQGLTWIASGLASPVNSPLENTAPAVKVPTPQRAPKKGKGR